MSFPIPVIRRSGPLVLIGASLALGACGSDASTGIPADAGGGSTAADGSSTPRDGATGADGSSPASDAGNEDAGGSGDAAGGSGGQSGDVCDPNHDTCAAPLKCCPTNLPTKSTCQSTDPSGACIPRP